MNDFNLADPRRGSGYGTVEPIGLYTAKTFLWMFLGLMTTFFIAAAGYATGSVFYIFSIPFMPFILLAAELGVVIFLSSRIERMAVSTARALFFVYAVLNGVVFSAYLAIFQLSSVILAFALTSAYFGLMAAIGYFTKADLSHMRPILISGLIFLVGFWVLSIFLPFSRFERVVSLIGIGIFLGFTAYDTQKIRYYHAAFGSDGAMASKASIYAALQLYLDFVNLFLYVLRFVGKQK